MPELMAIRPVRKNLTIYAPKVTSSEDSPANNKDLAPNKPMQKPGKNALNFAVKQLLRNNMNFSQ